MKPVNGPLVRQLLKRESVIDTINKNEPCVFIEHIGILGSIGHVYCSYIISRPIEEEINKAWSDMIGLEIIVDKKL